MKYVDDMIIFEAIPCNLSSLLGFAVKDVHNYCMEHSMRLNPKKCKDMVVNFMGNLNTIMRPHVYRKPNVTLKRISLIMVMTQACYFSTVDK